MPGTITQSLLKIPNSGVAVLTFTCTADASDATFPATATSDAITAAIRGFHLMEMRTNPGTPSPTANYDITLTDTDGIDLLAGGGADRHTTTSESVMTYAGRAIDGALTLALSNNAVNGAVVVVKLFLEL